MLHIYTPDHISHLPENFPPWWKVVWGAKLFHTCTHTCIFTPSLLTHPHCSHTLTAHTPSLLTHPHCSHTPVISMSQKEEDVSLLSPVRTMKCRKILKGHRSRVLHFDWSPDKSHVLTAGQVGRNVCGWCCSSIASHLHTYTSHTLTHTHTQDGNAVVWDGFLSQKEIIIQTSSWILACSYAPSTTLVACGYIVCGSSGDVIHHHRVKFLIFFSSFPSPPPSPPPSSPSSFSPISPSSFLLLLSHYPPPFLPSPIAPSSCPPFLPLFPLKRFEQPMFYLQARWPYKHRWSSG